MTITQENFQFISDLVRRKSAISLAPGKEYLVESRLMHLAREHGVSVDEYVAKKRTSLNLMETELIVEALTTNETSWFRDTQPFSALTQHILPELRKSRKPLGTLKVWSAACSTGQEPYSIAMTLKDYFDSPSFTDPRPSLDIVATDLSQQVLNRSKSGRYSQLEVNRGLPATHLVRHFHREGTEWEISSELRSMVRFQRHNLLDVPPSGGPFDVVFIRNVLIYFDVATKLEVLKKVRSVLRPGGFLILGAAETTVGIDQSWVRVPVGRSSVYQKAESAS
ncbi:CheR family methyltransferase [Timonella sp. A28]|uniref:CheR family methyltransferase n=1 Tax=Timonella sp. A28 TaxID=3442640 RepID=UPI003EBB3EBC